MAKQYKAFGEKLTRLRNAAGLTQGKLASEMEVSSFRVVSNWERGTRPQRELLLKLVVFFAKEESLTAAEAQHWVGQAEHELSHAELAHIFEDYMPPQPSALPIAEIPRDQPPLPGSYVNRPQLEQELTDFLLHSTGQHTLVLTGPGGSGKSTRAAWAAHSVGSQFPDGVVWLRGEDSQSVADLQAQLAHRLTGRIDALPENSPPAVRARLLRALLHERRCLLVLDDLWADMPDLIHLKLGNLHCPLLVTGRDKLLAHRFEAMPPLEVGVMTAEEGVDVLQQLQGPGAAKSEVLQALSDLVEHLPLALTIIGALLNLGETPAELQADLSMEPPDLTVLELESDPQRMTSLTRTLALSYNRLPSDAARRAYAQLGVFRGSFTLNTAAQVWALPRTAARKMMRQLIRYSLVEHHPPRQYRLHRLLGVYARQRLAQDWPALVEATSRRHAAYYILRQLAHPQLLGGDHRAEAGGLDAAWPDIVAGVAWAIEHAPALAVMATLLAHTERPALLAAVGPALIDWIADQTPVVVNNQAEQAVLVELLGELSLLAGRDERTSDLFREAAALWLAAEEGLAGSRATLRAAGAHLLRQEVKPATDLLGQARDLLAQSLPASPQETATIEQLFYWFNVVYAVLIKQGALSEAEVQSFAALAEKTGDLALMARGWHIYRLWCTAQPRPYSRATYDKARQFGARAACCWRRCGQKDQAQAEVMWAQEYTRWRRSRRLAEAFVRRRAVMTPRITAAQIAQFDQPLAQLWLKATTIEQRLKLLVDRLPLPGSDDEAWEPLSVVLNLGVRGQGVRRLIPGRSRPASHFLSEPMWRVLSGQRTLPLTGAAARTLVERFKESLANELPDL